MRRAICIGVFVLAAVAWGHAGQDTRGADQPRKLLDTYCISCHSTRMHLGGLALDTLALDAVHENADVWEKAIRKLRGRQMPPPGSRQPDQRDIDAFVEWMETKLDSSAGGPTAGRVAMQRLTRTEFGAAVSDLLGIELDATQLLPAE